MGDPEKQSPPSGKESRNFGKESEPSGKASQTSRKETQTSRKEFQTPQRESEPSGEESFRGGKVAFPVILMTYNGETVKAWAGESQWRAWRADLARFKKHGYSGWGSEGFWALTLYRLRHSIKAARPRLLWVPVRVVLAVINKFLTLVTHINLHPDAAIGPGMLIPHVGPIQVFPWARIGCDCAIHQVCTIGAGSKSGGPVIGDHVMIGCHTCILGPVSIGDGAKVGAGTVVVKDVPAGATAVGVPARIVLND